MRSDDKGANTQEFDGVGFSDICRCVRSMRDREWEVRMAPALISRIVKAFLPTIRAISDAALVHVSSTVKDDLLSLILSLEEEDWGLTL